MTLTERILRRFGYAKAAPTTRQFAAIAAYSPQTVSSPAVAQNILEYAARHPYYSAALTHIATAAMGVPLGVKRLVPEQRASASSGRKVVTKSTAAYIQRNYASVPMATRAKWLQTKAVQAEDVYDHPLRVLFDTVNSYMTWRELIYVTLLHLRAVGDAYWEIVGDKEPIALYPMAPDRVKVKPSKDDWVAGYTYTVNSVEIDYAPEQVLHFRLPHPDNDYYGLASGAVLERVLKADWDRLDYTVGLFENGMRIGGALVSKTDLGVDDATWQRQVDAFNKTHKGAKNAGKTVAFQDASFVPTQWSPRDAEYLGMADRHDTEISAVLGVPTQLFKAENVNRANYEAAQLQFWSDTMTPLLALVAGQINEFLAGRYGPDILCEFDLSVVAALQEDLGPASERARNAWLDGVLTADEYRIATGRDALEDERGQVFLRRPGFEYVPVAEFGENPEPPPAPEPIPPQLVTPPAEEEAIPAPPEPQDGPPAPKRVVPAIDKQDAPRAAYGDERHQRIWKAFDARAAEREMELFRRIAEWANGLKSETVAKLEGAKGFRLTKATPEALLFDVDAQGKAFWDIVRGSIVATMLAEGQIVLGQLAVWLPTAADFNFTEANPAVIEHLAGKELKVKTVVADMHEDLRKIVVQGQRDGLPIADLSDRITERFGHLETWQGERIARTETIGAQNLASGAASEELGLPVEWIATLDDRVRDSHAGLHGKVKEPGGVFSNGLHWPGDAGGAAEEVINCRCTVAAIPPEDTEEA